MHISSTVSAPRHASPFQNAFPQRAGFTLKTHAYLHLSPHSLKTSAADSATTVDTRAHIANLERVLRRQSPSPPEPGEGSSPRSVGNLLDRLRLPPLFPFAARNPSEETSMSPRSLTRLHGLLSDSAHPSPRGAVAHRWRRLHGSDNWDGLLDPLDGDLRHELLRCGDLIHAAYHAFCSHPYIAPDGPHPVALPDHSYRVTRHLFATASVEVPSWLSAAAAPRSSWIGFVAVCDSEGEIRRMGRRDIVIVLRGTSTLLEWAENFRANLVRVDDDADSNYEDQEEEERIRHVKRYAEPKVECGFRSLYKTPGAGVPSLSSAVVEEVQRLIGTYKGEELSITVAGHSLGAALSVLAAGEITHKCGPRAPPVAVFSFGGPRVGNKAFADRAEARGVKVLRVVNAHDVVTRVPWHSLAVEVGGGYSHVGRELRVDSRASPYLRPDPGPACCHDLEAYLHLVDGFAGAGLPFRPDAKRGLARLLTQQKSNVKRLYLANAKALGGIGPVRPELVDGDGEAAAAAGSESSCCLASSSS